jgi:hypothetical protein
VTDQRPAVVSTTFALSGLTDGDDVRAVTDIVSTVPGVGGVAIELVSAGRATMFLKHQADVELDRSAIETALRSAGDYAVVPDRS